MKIKAVLFLSILIGCLFYSKAEQTVFTAIYQNLDSNPELAEEQSKNILSEALSSGNIPSIVAANFVLGYIYDEHKAEYGKALIYYLEGIRYAENSTDEKVLKSRISMLKNSASIYSEFGSLEIAKQHLYTAISLSKKYEVKEGLMYALADILQDAKETRSAIRTLETLVIALKDESKRKYKIHNQLAIAYYDVEDFQKAIDFHKISLQYASKKRDSSSAFHNMGRNYFELGDLQTAYSLFKQSYQFDSLVNYVSGMTNSLRGMAEVKAKERDYKESISILEKAYKLADNDKEHNRKLFQELANAYYAHGDFEQARVFQTKFQFHTQLYIDQQLELQNTHQKYNIDLVTKRYYDEVERQQEYAELTFWFRTTCGILIFLLGLTFLYIRIEKLRLKKVIQKDLADLGVLK